MSDYRRLFLLFALASALMILTAGLAAAHPPKGVRLSWDTAGELTVTVEHSVDNPEKHYVSRIVVYAGNKVAASKDYSSQSGAGGMSDVFPLGAMPSGTVLKAEAWCVIMGSASGSVVVP
jgi:hypothetical protein